MKTGWVRKPIEAFAKTSAGGTPLRSQKAFYDGGDIPWLLSGEVGKRDIVSAQNYITEAGLKGSSAKVFPAGSVLVAMYGATAGEVGILRFEAATNQAVCAVLPSEQYVPEFLYYYLLLVKDELVAQAVGNAQPNISQAKIKALPVPLPPLDEQKRIVAVLDEAFEGLSRARANAEANLADAEALFSAAHGLALTSDTKARSVTLADVASIEAVLVDPKLPYYADLPHLGAGNMSTGSDLLLGVMSAREEGLTSGKFLFSEGTVLYSKIRPYLRKACRPDFDGLCSADVYPLTPKAGIIDRDYLFYLLLGPDFTAYAIEGSARAGMPKVNREHLFRYRFDLPDVETQKSVAAMLDRILEEAHLLKEQAGNKVKQIDTLRQSLLQKAFAGELT